MYKENMEVRLPWERSKWMSGTLFTVCIVSKEKDGCKFYHQLSRRMQVTNINHIMKDKVTELFGIIMD